MDRADINVLLQGLEAAIKRRKRHRGRTVFYQLLEYDLAPILAATGDQAYVHAKVREILVRYGHALEPPARTHVCAGGDLSHLCQSVPVRGPLGPPTAPT